MAGECPCLAGECPCLARERPCLAGECPRLARGLRRLARDRPDPAPHRHDAVAAVAAAATTVDAAAHSEWLHGWPGRNSVSSVRWWHRPRPWRHGRWPGCRRAAHPGGQPLCGRRRRYDEWPLTPRAWQLRAAQRRIRRGYGLRGFCPGWRAWRPIYERRVRRWLWRHRNPHAAAALAAACAPEGTRLVGCLSCMH